MCNPSSVHIAGETKRVAVIGAGPAGLLATILLLRRNAENNVKYEVTLVDPGPDYGQFDSCELNRKRSWMIGLSCHGLSAIRTVPGLYEEYVRKLGVDIQHAVIQLSKKIKFNLEAKDFIPNEDAAFTVDRNHICAALARYLNDNHNNTSTTGEKLFTSLYNTRALFVDDKNKRILVRNEGIESSNGDDNNDGQYYVDYDLLIGCDGIRSVVRNALATTDRDFEFSTRGTFGKFKAVHVDCPSNVKEGTFMLLMGSLPDCASFVLPETGNKLNVTFGYSLEKTCPDELLSDDVAVVSGYFKKYFTSFNMDCDDAAAQWVAQGWSTTGQVHCNVYHSMKQQILLMGDAAHATSPQIGQGMNTALADAAAFDKLLDLHKDNLNEVLPAFSAERVKEGNALTDLSFYTFSLSGGQQFMFMLHQNIHRLLHKILPMFVGQHPMDEVADGGKLSVAYDKMTKLGILSRIRHTNDKIMREHFEKTTGMVVEDKRRGSWKTYCAIGVAALSVVAAMHSRDMINKM